MRNFVKALTLGLMKKISGLLFSLLTVLVLTACGGNNEDAEATAAEEPTEETTEAREDVRVVAASVSAIGVLGELDGYVIGVPTTQHPLPAQFANLPEVGIATTPDIEKVASLEPDLFIMDAAFQENFESTLAELGINTLFFQTSTYDIFLESIATLGEKIDRTKEADALITQLEEAALEATELIGEDTPSVAVLFGNGETFMLLTGNSYVGGLVEKVGATNVASEIEGGLEAPALPFSLEQLVVQNPDILLRVAHGNVEQVAEMFAEEEMFQSEAFQSLDAVVNDRVYDLDFTIFGIAANIHVAEAFRTLGEIFGTE